MIDHREVPAEHYIGASDTLIVSRKNAFDREEIFLCIKADGNVLAFNGHVDLGTGIRTSLAQIVAEELCTSFEKVSMILGSTSVAPNQGATIASETIQVSAIPLRQASATARAYLLAEGARRLGYPIEKVYADDGAVRFVDDTNLFVPFGGLIAGQSIRLTIDMQAPLKSRSDYTIVGQGHPRSDIPAKARGTWTYVHDVRVPRMLHGRVIRPPYSGFDSGPHVGASLIGVDESSVANVDGLVGVVAIGDFVGVVATREERAIEAMQRLKVQWRSPPAIPNLNAPEQPLRDNPAVARTLADRGNVLLAFDAAAERLERTYVWPYQMHGSIGPSCAVADWSRDKLTVWSGTQNPFPLRTDLSKLLDMPEDAITVERLEAAGCYGRNCADDVTADAALLSRAVRAPVRVQLTREQEHAWEPKGAAQVMDVRGGLDLEGGPALYDFETRYPSNLAPTLPLVLTGKVAPVAEIMEMGDRTAIPPYSFPNLRVTVHDMPPLARASWFRGVSAMPNTFAHESFIDELATAAQVDPIEYRLRYLTDPRAIDLVRAVAERAEWKPHVGPLTHGGDGDILYGRGFAYAVYVHGKFPGTAAAWAAWVADVAVNRVTGEVAVTRVICGQDTGQVINPDGVRHQIHGNIIQSTSRVLKEQVRFSETGVSSVEWGAYPILGFHQVPAIDVVMVPRPDEPPLGAGESASVPSAAAIANAIFDATGVRFRELPLTPERIRAALNPLEAPHPRGAAQAPGATHVKPTYRRGWRWSFGGLLAGMLATGAAILPWRPTIAPINRPSANVFSPATIERGRLAVAAGACNVCHVGLDGRPFGGGRGLETPFGVIYASNITPDVDAGIGAWTYTAFARSMREGISRDGHHLYPAHPYTSFAKASEDDIQAMYAYLMTQQASSVRTPETELRFPFGTRAVMAVWNALFLSSKSPADPTQSAEWNRGAELVEGLGHCSACHSPRNLLSAEKRGSAHLAGGFVDGWHAHALTSVSMAPVSWTRQAFYDYLRSGRSSEHGPAAGPMAHVVETLSDLPDTDIWAMATYLASMNTTVGKRADEVIAASEAAAARAILSEPIGHQIFEGACAACHGSGTLIPHLALNTNLHASRPNNVIASILGGVPAPVGTVDEAMAMPAYAKSLDAESIEALVRYVRARFAPDKSAWQDVASSINSFKEFHSDSVR